MQLFGPRNWFIHYWFLSGVWACRLKVRIQYRIWSRYFKLINATSECPFSVPEGVNVTVWFLWLIGFKRTKMQEKLFGYVAPIRTKTSRNDLCDLPFETTLYTESYLIGWWLKNGYAINLKTFRYTRFGTQLSHWLVKSKDKTPLHDDVLVDITNYFFFSFYR